MTFRTPEDALDDLRHTISRALLCVTDAHLSLSRQRLAVNVPISIQLNRNVPASLRASMPLALAYRVQAKPTMHHRQWQMGISAYFYTLHDERHEILAYHWHPEQTPTVVFPHLHLEAGSGVRRYELTRAHLPTGGVSLAAFLRMAIRDFGVVPRRDNWHDVLTRHDTAFAITGETHA